MDLDGFLNRSHDVYGFKPESSIPDLSNKVIVVTGGNAGLGLESIIQLAQHSPLRIYLLARSQAKYDGAVAEISQRVATAKNCLRFVEADLTSLASVKAAADTILSETDRIDILMNNAGVMGAAPGLTKDGYEVHFGINHMGHALLTKLLLPLMLKTAETSDVRIVNVSSGAYKVGHSNGFDPSLVKTDMANCGSLDTVMPRYGQSKLANVLHARGLAKHYPTITSVAIAPGRVKTDLLNNMYSNGRDKFYGYFQKFYDTVIGAKNVTEGAYTQVWAATEPKKERLENGFMYSPVGVKDAPFKFTADDRYVDKLWEFTENELKRLGY